MSNEKHDLGIYLEFTRPTIYVLSGFKNTTIDITVGSVKKRVDIPTLHIRGTSAPRNEREIYSLGTSFLASTFTERVRYVEEEVGFEPTSAMRIVSNIEDAAMPLKSGRIRTDNIPLGVTITSKPITVEPGTYIQGDTDRWYSHDDELEQHYLDQYCVRDNSIADATRLATTYDLGGANPPPTGVFRPRTKDEDDEGDTDGILEITKRMF